MLTTFCSLVAAMSTARRMDFPDFVPAIFDALIALIRRTLHETENVTDPRTPCLSLRVRLYTVAFDATSFAIKAMLCSLPVIDSGAPLFEDIFDAVLLSNVICANRSRRFRFLRAHP